MAHDETGTCCSSTSASCASSNTSSSSEDNNDLFYDRSYEQNNTGYNGESCGEEDLTKDVCRTYNTKDNDKENSSPTQPINDLSTAYAQATDRPCSLSSRLPILGIPFKKGRKCTE